MKIKNRYKDPDTSHLPGPADYTIQDLSKTKVPAMQSRGPIMLGYVPDSPGPAAYSVRSTIGGGTPRTAIRPKTGPIGTREKNPGYTYNQKSRIGGDSPAWTISRRTNDSRNSRNREPCSAEDYNTNQDGGRTSRSIRNRSAFNNYDPENLNSSSRADRRGAASAYRNYPKKTSSDNNGNKESSNQDSTNGQIDNNTNQYDRNSQRSLSSARRSESRSSVRRKHEEITPGPGDYDTTTEYSHKFGPAIRPKTSFSRWVADTRAPYEDTRVFPEVKRKTIGPQCRTDFTDVATKDCQFPLFESTLNKRDIKIGLKFPEKTPVPMPGPTDYFADGNNSRNSAAFSVKGPMARDDWLPKDLSVPGPGAYDIRSGNTLPKWTIGDKSRLSSRRSASVRSSRTAKSALSKTSRNE